MKQSLFEARYQPEWQAFTRQLEQLEKNHRRLRDCADFPQQYRHLCHHLALAQERGYSSYLIDPLQQLALRGHQQLYRNRNTPGASLLGFILADFPRLVREQWPFVLVASLLLFGSLIGMAVLTYVFPELIFNLLSPQRVADMHSMYDPDASRLGRSLERASSENWVMFGYYIMNNIGIAFQTFASGLLFGLGSLFFLLFNGMTIGAVAGHLTQVGFGQTFWSFVIGHGAFELTAIALAGAAGLQLGWALIAPARLPRSEALRQAARKSAHMVGGVILFLLIAAFIEAYWSSIAGVAYWIKYSVGAVLWLLMAAYLGFAGRTAHASE